MQAAADRRADTHIDLPILIREKYGNKIYGDNFKFRAGLAGDVDIARMAQGHVGVSCAPRPPRR